VVQNFSYKFQQYGFFLWNKIGILHSSIKAGASYPNSENVVKILTVRPKFSKVIVNFLID